MADDDTSEIIKNDEDTVLNDQDPPVEPTAPEKVDDSNSEVPSEPPERSESAEVTTEPPEQAPIDPKALPGDNECWNCGSKLHDGVCENCGFDKSKLYNLRMEEEKQR